MASFIEQYRKLDIPGLELSYSDNLGNIRSIQSIEEQTVFFNSVKQRLAKFIRKELQPEEKTDFDQIAYETRLNLN
jgi:hypothetical protein